MTTQGLGLNWYLVPFFGVHRICVPYGMWGLKTQQVIHPERTTVYLTDGCKDRKILRYYALDLGWKMLNQSHPFRVQDMEDILVED